VIGGFILANAIVFHALGLIKKENLVVFNLADFYNLLNRQYTVYQSFRVQVV